MIIVVQLYTGQKKNIKKAISDSSIFQDKLSIPSVILFVYVLKVCQEMSMRRQF